MKTTTYTLILLAGVAGFGAMPPANPQPAQTGKVLLLDSEQLLEGNIEKVGNEYRIKRPMGEITLPAKRAIALVQTRKQAFEILRQYADLRDPDEHLRLARWCMLQDLRDEAIAEAQEVLRIDSKNSDARIILLGLRQTKPLPETRSRPASQTVSGPQPIVEVTPAEFNRESFGLFVTKVQPILMNTCISCHGNGKGGAFQLLRATLPGDRRANLQNLAVALKFLDRKNPAKSPLLRKSITAHGDAVAAPLRDKKLLAYDNLEAWVSLALAPDGSEEGIPLVHEEKPVERKWEPMDAPQTTKKKGPVFGEASSSKPVPEMKTAPSDPFDPAIFNGEIQPKK